MYAGKRYPLSQTVRWSSKYLFIFIIYDAIVISVHELMHWDWLMLPWQPISLVGIAVAFYLGFKNNSSYERLWEARKIWGGIVNSSRTFTVMLRDFIKKDGESNHPELYDLKKKLVHRHVAWLNALAIQLRARRAWEHNDPKNDGFRKLGNTYTGDDHSGEVKPYLNADDVEYLKEKGNKASHILSIQSRELSELKRDGKINDFEHMKLMGLIEEFYTLQGKSERIKNFPFPRQYATVNYYFVWLFIIMIPFAMLSIFSEIDFQYFIWMAIPISVMVSWVFILMEMIGDYSENPFEGLYNDVPITSISRGIEKDIRQMLEEKDLPDDVPEVAGFNIQL